MIIRGFHKVCQTHIIWLSQSCGVLNANTTNRRMARIFQCFTRYLNHFTQPDSIIPGGVQGYDRYAYANNNPVRYSDPSGNSPCDQIPAGSARDACQSSHPSDTQTTLDQDLQGLGITLDGDPTGWTFEHKYAVYYAALLVGHAFASARGNGETDVQAFNAVYGGINITWGLGTPGKANAATGECATITTGGCTKSSHQINFASLAPSGTYPNDYSLRQINNVIHEFGHAFSWAKGGAPTLLLDDNMTNLSSPGYNQLLVRGTDPNLSYGFASSNNDTTWVQDSSTKAGEVFADQFLGWTRNNWETDPNYGGWSNAGNARATWMTTNMAKWLKP